MAPFRTSRPSANRTAPRLSLLSAALTESPTTTNACSIWRRASQVFGKNVIICHGRSCSKFSPEYHYAAPINNAYRFRPPLPAEGPRREMRRRRPSCGSHFRAVERVIEFSDVWGFRSRWLFSFHLMTRQSAPVTWHGRKQESWSRNQLSQQNSARVTNIRMGGLRAFLTFDFT